MTRICSFHKSPQNGRLHTLRTRLPYFPRHFPYLPHRFPSPSTPFQLLPNRMHGTISTIDGAAMIRRWQRLSQ